MKVPCQFWEKVLQIWKCVPVISYFCIQTPRRLRPTEDRLTRRKVLGERNELSSTTVTSGASASEMSLSSMGTYQDFAVSSLTLPPHLSLLAFYPFVGRQVYD